MQYLVKLIVAAILDWTLGLLTKVVKALLSYFKKREHSEDLDKKLEQENDPAKREEISDEILNGKP